MNAHTPSRSIVSAQDVKAQDCPAAELGVRLAAIHRRRVELEKGPGGPHVDEESDQLHDLWRELDRQLEWVRATSVEGLVVQVLQLGILLEEMREDDGRTPEAEQRRSRRLHDQILGGLEALAGVDAEGLGLGLKVCRSRARASAFDLARG